MPTILYANAHQNLSTNAQVSLFIFGTEGDLVEIDAGNGYTTTATIGADGSVTVVLPDTQIMSGTGINTQGIQISSDGNISAYLSNRETFTTDLTVLFDSESLGNTHVLASSSFFAGEGGQFSAQATEDDTSLTFTLPDGQTATIELNAGETFKFATGDFFGNSALGLTLSTGFDLTGTIVSADRPIAVFSGHTCSNVGIGFCDHLVEQMPPVSSLSQSYVVGEAFSSAGLGNNLIRVVAPQDNTEVLVDGVLVATLNTGEFHEFTLSDTAAQIETSAPALVAQYLQGSTTAGEGDPALSFVPGVETWLSSYIVATPSGAEALAQNLVNVVVPTAAIDTLTVNGTNVDTALFAEVGGTAFSVANIPVDPGVIRVAAAENFQLSLFGYDDFDSFLTFGGANFASGLSNVPPVAENDFFEVLEGEIVTGNLFLDNGNGPDFDRDGDPLTVIEVNGSAANVGVDVTLTNGAVLRVEENGDFTYTASLNFDLGPGVTIGSNFSYRVSDGTASDLGLNVVSVTGTDGTDQAADFSLSLPDSLSLAENGQASLSFTEPASDPDQPFLVAISADRGLVSDPLSGSFSDTSFVLVRPESDGTIDAIDVDIKGTAGPLSSVQASAQLADNSAVSDIAARVLAFQPDFMEQAVLDRIEANLEATFGTTVGSLTATLGDHADTFEALGLNTTSASSALAFAIEAAGDYGSIAERGQLGSLGQGWAALSDLGLEIDGTSVRMTGLADLGALEAFSVDAVALYTVSNSAGRAVTLSGDVLGLGSPPRPVFEQGIDGQFQTVSGFDGTLTSTDAGYAIEMQDGARMLFDANGTFLAMVSSDGLQIEAQYNSDGQLEVLTGPNAARLEFAYDTDGNVFRVEDADGDLAEFAYDADGQLASVERPDGTSSFTYDALGDMTSASAPGNISAAFAYDAMGRLETASYGGGAQTETMSYNSSGGVTITDGAGRSVDIDLLPGSIAGRITDGAGGTSELIYDDEGNIAGVRAPDGSETGFAFDALGRLTQITDANGSVLEFGYGEDGEDPTSFTDAGGATRSFEYDAGGRITEATWADGSTLQFVYDLQGNLTGYSNRRGDDVTYTYDARGRVTAESDGSAGSTLYTYDDRGRLTEASNDQGTTSLVYDAADRVIQIDYPTGKSLVYTYNDAGLRASMSDGEDYTVFYSYDALGRLTELRDETSSLVTYEYDAAGNLTREENGNGTVSLYSYDDAGRLTRIENQAPDASINSFNAYTYDAAGQRVENATQDGVWTYGYDAIGQLTSAEFASGNAAIADKSIAYAYDAAGNRTSVTEDGVVTLYTANELNQYTAVGDETFTYDADGNMTSRTDSEGTTVYAYDIDNRLTSVSHADGSVREFAYDVFGNRVGQTVDGVETEYLVDPFGLGDVISEFRDGEQTASYAHGLGLAATEIGGVSAFYDADAVGTVTTLTGADGSVENAYVFTPFGTEMFEVEGVANSFEFNGILGVAEDADDLTYMRARSYSDELGRFLSEDPLWLSGDAANLYRFAINDPKTFVDPTGNDPEEPTLADRLGNLDIFGNGAAEESARRANAGDDQGAAEAANSAQERQRNASDAAPAASSAIDAAGSLFTGVRGAVAEAAEQIARQIFGDDEISELQAPSLDPGSPVSEPIQSSDPGSDGAIFNNIEPQAGDSTQTEAPEGNGRNDGDPHLSTFDGTGYSFQAVGEFTMVLGDGFEMQTRTEAINASVSVNTATVMNIGEDVVGVYAREAIPLVVNGTAVPLQRGESIAVGEGSVYRGFFGGSDEFGNFDVYVVTDGNGNGFWTNVYFGANHLRPFVNDDTVVGLLGNLNGDRTDDFQLRDGTVLDQPLPQSVLYGEYADSWRIDQADSLFLYRDGESTETFTDRSFPTSIITYADLDPVERAAAEQVAIDNGLTPGTFEFETTVLDIVLTGSEDFAIGVGGAPEFQEPENVIEIVEVEINEAPDLPEDAQADVLEDGTTLIDILSQISDAEGDALFLIDGTDPNGGIVEVVGGVLRFTPAPDFEGETTLIYRVGDAGGNVVAGEVTVTVEGQPDAPVANDESGEGFITDEDTPFTTANVLDNDFDADGDPLTIIDIDTTDTLGLVTSNGDGTFSYDPNGAFEALGLGETGSDSFDYIVSDGNGGTDRGTVNLMINGAEDEVVGPNQVLGTAASDNIVGTSGDDQIISLGGSYDRVFGGDGADQFVFGAETNNGARERDVIRDYEVGIDSILLAAGAEVASIRSYENKVILFFEGDRDAAYVLGEGVSEETISISYEDEFAFA